MTKPTKQDELGLQAINMLTTALEQGNLVNWLPSFLKGSDDPMFPRSFGTGNPYSGLNSLICLYNTPKDGSPFWLTAKNCRDHGISYAGTKGKWVTIIKFSPFKTTDKVTGEEVYKKFLKKFVVINASHLDIPEKVQAKMDATIAKRCEVQLRPELTDPITLTEETCMEWMKNAGVRFQIGEYSNGECVPWLGGRAKSYDSAHYVPLHDRITMPKPKQFVEGRKGYAHTLAHECCHATGQEWRLNRDLTGRPGSKAYAKEEVVAEIGAAIITASTGTELLEANCAAYVKHWLDLCQDSPSALSSGIKKAQDAAAMVLSKTEGKKVEKQEEVATA